MKKRGVPLFAMMVSILCAGAAEAQMTLGGVYYYGTPYLRMGGYDGAMLPPVYGTPLPPALPPLPPGPVAQDTYYVISNGVLRQYDRNYNLVNETRLPPYIPWPQGGATPADILQAGSYQWNARLSGLQSQGYTEASGSACFWLDPSGEALHYQVAVADLRNIADITVNLNDPDLPPEAAPAVARLYCCRTKGGRHTGVIAQGTIRDCDLLGWLAGYRVADLVQALNQGQGFVNVRTAQRPQGELMGTIRAPAPTVVVQRP